MAKEMNLRSPLVILWMSLGLLMLLLLCALAMNDLDLIREIVVTPNSAEIRLVSVKDIDVAGGVARLGLFDGPLGPLETWTLMSHGYPAQGFTAYAEIDTPNGKQVVELGHNQNGGNPAVIEEAGTKKVIVAVEEVEINGEDGILIREYESKPKIKKEQDKTGKTATPPVDLPKDPNEYVEITDPDPAPEKEGHVRRTKISYRGGDQSYDYVTVTTSTGKELTLAIQKGRKAVVQHPTDEHPDIKLDNPTNKLMPVKVSVIENKATKGPAGTLIDAISQLMKDMGLIR